MKNDDFYREMAIYCAIRGTSTGRTLSVRFTAESLCVSNFGRNFAELLAPLGLFAAAKTTYAAEQGLGGVFFWEGGQDAADASVSLVAAARKAAEEAAAAAGGKAEL